MILRFVEIFWEIVNAEIILDNAKIQITKWTIEQSTLHLKIIPLTLPLNVGLKDYAEFAFSLALLFINSNKLLKYFQLDGFFSFYF